MTTKLQPLPAGGETAPLNDLPGAPLPDGLDRETLVRVFRLMYLSRTLDDREILLKRQNKIFFQISAAGHEAVQIAAGHGIAARARLGSSVLSRPGALPRFGRDAERHAAAGGGRRPRPGFRRPADALPLVIAEHCTSSPVRRRRERNLCRQWDAPKESGYLNAGSDEITLVSFGRRRHQRGRILGGHEHRLPGTSARC